MSVEEDRKIAQKKMKGYCAVYKECDGDPSRLCQGQSYGRALGMGGAGSGSSFTNNVQALKKVRLKMITIGEDFDPNPKTSIFGKEIASPVMAASVSGVNSFGGEEVISEKELCRAIVLGCRKTRTIGFRGDTYTYSIENAYGLDAIEEADGWGIKICKPRSQETIMKFFDRAEKIGAIAVGVDVDGCGSLIMAKHKKPVFKKTVDDIKELVTSTNLPVILKGIMTVENAQDAIEAGAEAIVVSNHGGRVLDGTPGTAEVLPKIVNECKGQITIFVDGGVRTGYDVLKMLALGAEGVLMGRDVIRAAVGGGIDGVHRLMEHVKKTLEKAMKMTGVKRIKDVTSDILAK
ncbi:MAG: alpha-hydroxy-acid oxidizing protein [Candidatus Heimdallarchaeota archaeon]|nr:alpha-hydroxy-acid oxidizing protein [Candidatus Heimdallarchaeota archaeon]